MDISLPLSVVILAAGKGTRMKSASAKVLHEVFYRPMLHYVLDSVVPLEPENTIAVIGHQKEAVIHILDGFEVSCCEQLEQNGTGHAVICTQPLLKNFHGNIMILNGDAPLLLPEHLQQMVQSHERSGARLTIMTTLLEDPTNYGRILSDPGGTVQAVVEEKDATEKQRKIREINAGIYIADGSFLFSALARVTTDNAQQELYLTDIVGIAVGDGIRVNKFVHPHPEHVLGVNSKVELAQAHREISSRRNHELMAQGVTMLDPLTTSIGPGVAVGSNCCLAPSVTIVGKSSIGSGCTIEQGVYGHNAVIGNDVRIGANSVVIDQRVADGTTLAPLTMLDGSRS